MTEQSDQKQDGGFKVTDRRKFTMEGELRPEAAAEQAAAAASPQKESPPPKPAAPPPVEREEPETETPFERLVVSFASTAMMQLGLVAADPSQPAEPDLAGARDTINMLGVLEDKTRGNLTSRESRLMQETLAELRMAFVEMQKRRGARR